MNGMRMHVVVLEWRFPHLTPSTTEKACIVPPGQHHPAHANKYSHFFKQACIILSGLHHPKHANIYSHFFKQACII
jgi:hypothetical protein